MALYRPSLGGGGEGGEIMECKGKFGRDRRKVPWFVQIIPAIQHFRVVFFLLFNSLTSHLFFIPLIHHHRTLTLLYYSPTEHSNSPVFPLLNAEVWNL